MLTFAQAEKSTLALRRFHPELRDVWGDLERDIEVVVPTKAEQPPNLKVQLLPFQLESLSWFKDQEKSIWSGGMLAVRDIPSATIRPVYITIYLLQDEMGWALGVYIRAGSGLLIFSDV